MKTTYIYDQAQGKMLPRRLVQVERELRQMRRERAVLVGFLVLWSMAAAMLGILIAPHVANFLRLIFSSNLM